MNNDPIKAWLPDVTIRDGKIERELPVCCDANGLITIPPAETRALVRLPNRALLPGLVNAHSHAFQRVIRGRTEHRTSSDKDSFWTWRSMMYSAAERLTPEDIYDASRMAFLEMALSGITAVGEFHYLHHSPNATPYDDVNLLAKEVVRAARDVGLRIVLLRVAYERSGHNLEPNPQQARFIERNPETFLENTQKLIDDFGKENDQHVRAGVAPHSVRAVSLNYLREVVNFANERKLVVHMHVAEQPAEVSACIEEHGRSPVALLATEGLLNERFTGVHVIHVTRKAIKMFAEAGAIACACPTTERNLGDGVFPADLFINQNVRVALGTDSHTQIDLLEDARELEYHLRLQKMERAVLSRAGDDDHAALAERLLQSATQYGAESIGIGSGRLAVDQPADFFTVDLDDPSIAGATEEDLLPAIVFSASRAAIRDVVVGGKQIVENGRHADQEEIVEKFKTLQTKLWA